MAGRKGLKKERYEKENREKNNEGRKRISTKITER